MAGVGKTMLAEHWAHLVRDRFPDGQLYVNLRGHDPRGWPMDPATALRTFLDGLGVPPHRIPPDVDAQVGLYRSLLADRRLLILLDNAYDAHQVRPLLPTSPDTLVVITSRNHLAGLLATDGAHLLTLEVPTVEDARALLVRRLGRARALVEPHAVDEIVAACARLPLAIALAASHAASDRGRSLAALADNLRRTRNR